MSKLPPLTAVRAFEAAARLGSFTKAAQELGMTQAAISYQVKLLEERVGAPLFLREPRRVVLSEIGRRLAPQVSEAFQRLNAAFAALRKTTEGVLSISAVHTLATNWLVPRLGAFQLAHPDIAVRLDVSSRNIDFAREEFDVGIRSGQGVWLGLKAHRLLVGEFTPLLSPALLARAGPLGRPADLLRLPRLGAHDEWWRRWFELAGVSDVEPPTGGTLTVEVQSMAGTAAIAGQGVAILMPAFFAAESQPAGWSSPSISWPATARVTGSCIPSSAGTRPRSALSASGFWRRSSAAPHRPVERHINSHGREDSHAGTFVAA